MVTGALNTGPHLDADSDAGEHTDEHNTDEHTDKHTNEHDTDEHVDGERADDYRRARGKLELGPAPDELDANRDTEGPELALAVDDGDSSRDADVPDFDPVRGDFTHRRDGVRRS